MGPSVIVECRIQILDRTDGAGEGPLPVVESQNSALALLVRLRPGQPDPHPVGAEPEVGHGQRREL